MSGGHFEYIQYRINDVETQIENIINKNGKLKSKDELLYFDNYDYYEKYPEEKYHIKYSDKIIEEFKTGLIAIKLANIYIDRIDRLVSGDDGEESFIKRLESELNKLYKQIHIIKKDDEN